MLVKDVKKELEGVEKGLYKKWREARITHMEKYGYYISIADYCHQRSHMADLLGCSFIYSETLDKHYFWHNVKEKLREGKKHE